MTRTVPSAAAVVAALLLAACSATPTADTPSPSAAPSASAAPTPTIPVGPIALDDAGASERYLGIVCQINLAANALNAAIRDGEPTFLNGGSPEVTAIQSAATEAGRVSTQAVELFDDDYFTWPETIAEDIRIVRDSIIPDLGAFSYVANVTTYSDAYYYVFPTGSEAAIAAPQEIRYQLGISNDTTASCSGYETAQDTLHAEMLERDAYLAGFEQ